MTFDDVVSRILQENNIKKEKHRFLVSYDGKRYETSAISKDVAIRNILARIAKPELGQDNVGLFISKNKHKATAKLL